MATPFLDLTGLHADLQDELDEAWRRITRSAHFVGGQAVERFEAEWAAYCGTAHCVGTANGTAALELTLRALGIGPGDEVVVPANTFVATAEAVAVAGARPVFIDVDPATLLMTADGLRQALTPRTAAVIVVHLYGQMPDMDALAAVADRAGIALIEDAAQAHGATWRGRRAGGLSRAGCFSFYPGKNLGAFGDAGAVVTDDAALADRVRMIGNHGRPAHDAHRHDTLGTCNRLDALQAAVLSVKLRHLEGWNAGRRRVAARYAAALTGLPVELTAGVPGAVGVHHLMAVRCDDRDAVRGRLAAEGIQTGIHYPIPCHRQRAFRADAGELPSLPVVERAAGRLLSLPMYPHLGDGEVLEVAAALARALAKEAALERGD
ncbi:MAG TPA: DegT/DnrJ/EryC1/StrS family aminotransferase [Azospirillaceae bacterium]|nr:DegT/DnrJ/EryC1/StrS family aminotransferase [Azospirillaceae bacterium]